MPSKEYLESLEALNKVKPQIRVPIVPGMSVRKKKDSYDTIPVIRIHYSADPDRDPKTKTGQLWRKKKRGEYSSQADWDREMEIIDGAGGGERIYAEILSTHFKKIVITDPTWQPGKTWKLISGFDYGKTNPTSALDARVDHDGKIYFVGEYYQPGKDIGGHAPTLLGWNAFMACEDVMCDPSIFNKTMEQRDTKKAISVADIYYECGITNLRPFIGNRSDIAFEQRLKMHWNNLDEKEPTIRIWCPGLTEIPDRPVYGQHDGCPSLLWEMSNIRRVKLTATQLMTQNPSEQIVDKDNHAHDCIAEHTCIATLRGSVPIELVKIGDKVLTRLGWRRVEAAWFVRRANVLRVQLSNGRSLDCTPDHRILVDGKFIPASELKYGMMLTCTKASTVHLRLGLGWESISTAIRKARTRTSERTSGMVASISTRLSGFLSTSSRFPLATSCTTPTQTLSTMSRITLWPSLTMNIDASMPDVRTSTICVRSVLKDVSELKSGIALQRDAHGTANTPARLAVRCWTKFARSAANLFRTKTDERAIPSVQLIAEQLGVIATGLMSRFGRALIVGTRSLATATLRLVFARAFVQVRIVGIQPVETAVSTYDLTVEGAHEFCAGGILVHNCKKYIVMTLPEPTAKTTEQRIQEAIKDRVEVGDVTNAMRIAQDVRQQIAEEEEPASFANRFAVNEPTSFKPARMGSRFGGRRR